MKTLLTLISTFVVNAAIAGTCPDLSGTYKQVFPTATNTVLKVDHGTQGMEVLNLSVTNEPRPWNWQLVLDGVSHAKSLGAIYRDVHEIARCDDRQVHSTLFGQMLDGGHVVNFTQTWILYKNTSGQLVWQTNYRDDVSEEKLSIFKYNRVQ